MTERQEELIKKFQSVFGENWKYQINDITSDEKSEEIIVVAEKDEGMGREEVEFTLLTNETGFHKCEMRVFIQAKSMQDAYQNEWDVQMYWEDHMWDELEERLGANAELEPGDTDPIDDDGGAYDKFNMDLVMKVENLEQFPTMDSVNKCIEWIEKETEEFDPHWADEEEEDDDMFDEDEDDDDNG